MRAAAVAMLAVLLAFAAPAKAAIAPPPTVLDFESAPSGALDGAFYAVAGATLTRAAAGAVGFCDSERAPRRAPRRWSARRSTGPATTASARLPSTASAR